MFPWTWICSCSIASCICQERWSLCLSDCKKKWSNKIWPTLGKKIENISVKGCRMGQVCLEITGCFTLRYYTYFAWKHRIKVEKSKNTGKYKGWRTKYYSYNEDLNLPKPLSMLLFMLLLIGQNKGTEFPNSLSCNFYITESKSSINIVLDCKYHNQEYGNGPLYKLSRALALRGPEKSSKLEILIGHHVYQVEVPENSISISSSSSVFLTFQFFLGMFQIVKNKILMRALASG